MSPLVPIALFGVIPAAWVVLSFLTPRRALIAIYVFAWLLLPVAGYKVAGAPGYSKATAVSLSALLALAAVDSARFAAFRPRLTDLPILVWCLSPSVSSLVNGLGINEALVVLSDQVFSWGVPYFLGRVYLDRTDAMRDLAMGVVYGGLLYVPLCLYEIRMSPQLHTMFYGFHQHNFLQSIREGGWRPTVFLQHGLAVALFMASAAFVALVLWRQRAAQHVRGVSMAWIALGLVVVAVLCKSFGAVALLAAGVAVLLAARTLRSKLPILLLLLVAPVYMGVRAPGLWSGQSLLEISREISQDRAESLELRLNSENALAAHALQKPILGWGGCGRNMVDENGDDLAVTDGFWVIVLGKYGLLGLAAVTTVLLLPVLLIVLRIPIARLFQPDAAPTLAMLMIVVFFAIDCLFNAMYNPLFVLAAGGLAGLRTEAAPISPPSVSSGPRLTVGEGQPSVSGPQRAGRI